MRRIFQIIIGAVLCFEVIGVCFAEDFEKSLRQLKEPVSVVHADMFLDGATIGVVLNDAANNFFKFCLDGKMGSASAGNFFLGVNHPSQGGIRVASGSDTENYLIKILEYWVSLNSGREESNIVMVKRILENVKARRVSEFNASAQGPFTKDEAIIEARKWYPENSRDVRVIETTETFNVIFVGGSFQEDGKNWQSDFTVSINKATRKLIFASASNVREVP